MNPDSSTTATTSVPVRAGWPSWRTVTLRPPRTGSLGGRLEPGPAMAGG
jgi:hypothetical protein